MPYRLSLHLCFLITPSFVSFLVSVETLKQESAYSSRPIYTHTDGDSVRKCDMLFQKVGRVLQNEATFSSGKQRKAFLGFCWIERGEKETLQSSLIYKQDLEKAGERGKGSSPSCCFLQS